MKKKEYNTEDQELNCNTPENEVIDTDILTDNMADGDQTGEKANDKVAAECKEWQDRYLRLSAEFDNFRKRTLKEKMDLVASGGEDVIKAILPVVDDFERAIDAMGKRGDDIQAEREGVRLIYQKFIDILKSKNVTRIDALGKPLDTDYHDAVAKVPVEDPAKKGAVIDVVQNGYMLGDKVLRFARVVVGE